MPVARGLLSVKRFAVALGVSLLLLFALGALWLWPRYDYLPALALPFKAERMSEQPIIHAGLSTRLSEFGGWDAYVNINGPALIRVPAWLPNPLGKYYLYFSHHKGDHIRMAYADSVAGPWTVYEPGTLTLATSGFPSELSIEEPRENPLQVLWDNYSIYVVRDMLLLHHRSTVVDQETRLARGLKPAANSAPHIASPEIVIDAANRRLLMYYHGLAGKTAQYTRIAESADGLSFTALPGIVRSNYLRMFQYRDDWYGLAMPGILYRSPNGIDNFEPRDKLLFEPDMRHAGLWLQGDTLYVFWSRVGDAPESILVSAVDLSASNWDEWRATEPQVVLRPELPWEGSELKVDTSLRGEMGLPSNEVRDPYVFTDDDGQVYLLYVGSGEQAIGLARLLQH